MILYQPRSKTKFAPDEDISIIHSLTTCSEFDGVLETEFQKYDFDGIKIIIFPVNLYLDDD